MLNPRRLGTSKHISNARNRSIPTRINPQNHPNRLRIPPKPLSHETNTRKRLKNGRRKRIPTDGQPPIPPPSHPLQRNRSTPSQINGRPRHLRRLQLNISSRHRPVLARKRDRISSPPGLKSIKTLIKPSPPLTHRNTSSQILLRRPPNPEPQQQPPTTEQIDTGQRPPKQSRRIPGRIKNIGPQQNPRSSRSSHSQQNKRIQTSTKRGRNRRRPPTIPNRGMNRSQQPIAHPQTVRTKLLDPPSKPGNLINLMSRPTELGQRKANPHTGQTTSAALAGPRRIVRRWCGRRCGSWTTGPARRMCRCSG